MKKLICLCLALAVLASLAAGCNVVIGDPPPTTRNVGRDELSQAIIDLGATGDDAAEALKKFLEGGGNVVDIPLNDTPPMTVPPTMPQGSAISSDDVRPLMEKLNAMFASDTLTMRVRGSAPVETGGVSAMAFTMARSGEKLAMEFEIASISPGQSFQERLQAAQIIALLGSKVRTVVSPESNLIVFPDKKFYIDGGAGGESLEGMMPGKMPDDARVESSRVTVDGKEYLCATASATVEGSDTASVMRYYFLNGDLKRIEFEIDGEIVVLEIDQITTTVDPAIFSTAGFTAKTPEEMLAGSDMAAFAGLMGPNCYG